MVETEDNAKISQEMLLKRLRRIEGQIRGIQKMIVCRTAIVSAW